MTFQRILRLYADPQVLRGQVARLIKMHQPDAVFCPDPGSTWSQWHKTDHRMAANITQDSFIAADWHLYYPQHLLDEGLKPYSVPTVYYYYSRQPNYEVDISSTFELKIKASTAHVSQFEPSISKYTDQMPAATYDKIEAGFTGYHKTEDGTFIERFRRVER